MFALYSVTGFRQSVAIVICYLFVAMIMNRFWIISVLLILLAFNFHSTAIIFLLLFLAMYFL
ncbi:EpsG family protein [Morganella morganii]|uniref:EpsG family protein n=1 Tax=Morganella morganii TaxID=582 RepID=UPI003BF845EF